MDILTISPEYADRMHRWLIASFKLVVHHGGFQHSLMGLGRLDCALRSADRLFRDFIQEGKVGEPGNMLIDFPYLSDLWTMGMYEVLRTLNQKLRNDANFGKAHPVTGDVRKLKDKFARVRIPLAKFEPAYNYSRDNNYISQHVFRLNLPQNISGSTGYGWDVSAKTEIFRNDLADEVLNLFDKFDDTEFSLAFKK